MRSTQNGVEAAERAFRRLHMKPQHVGAGDNFSLYAERFRFARLAAYVVHLSLLLIFSGGIVDAIWGYRGYMALNLDSQSNQIDMRDGTKKMSKSDPGSGHAIALLDPPAVIRKKFLRATTDSLPAVDFDALGPGVDNLLNIFQAFSEWTSDQMRAHFSGMRYGDLKKTVAEAVVAGLEPIQKKYREITPEQITEAFRLGSERARLVAPTAALSGQLERDDTEELPRLAPVRLADDRDRVVGGLFRLPYPALGGPVRDLDPEPRALPVEPRQRRKPVRCPQLCPFPRDPVLRLPRLPLRRRHRRVVARRAVDLLHVVEPRHLGDE